MSKPRLFLPFLIIFILVYYSPLVMAQWNDHEIVSFNAAKNGALILEQRINYLALDLPINCDIYFAGSSRTMADYDADLFATELSNRMGLDESLCARNLGNIADSSRIFEEILRRSGITPKLLVLEFSPHLFYRDSKNIRDNSYFREHRNFVRVFELKTSGWIYDLFNLDRMIKWAPSALYIFTGAAISNKVDFSDLYPYLAFTTFGRGQSMQQDGQVYYHAYIQTAEFFDNLALFADTDLNDFEKSYKNTAFNEVEWKTYLRILETFDSGQILVLRPPVTPEMYHFENNELDHVIHLAQQAFMDLGIPYIDLNPNQYESIDHSHIDWYSTGQVAIDLAELVAPVFLVETFK